MHATLWKSSAVRRYFNTRTLVIALILLAIASEIEVAYGLGVRIPNQDAEAIGRGNAFVATANNPSAIYYNPAGITQLKGHNLQAGALNYLGLTSTYRSPSGRESETEYEIVPVPQVYYAFTPNESPLSCGLGLYAPFGLGIEWPNDTGFRTLALESRLLYVTLNPVVAYQIYPTLSVAAGPTLSYSKLELRQGIGLGVPNDEFRYEGDAFSVGFSAGLLWQPFTKWFVGASYKSPTSLHYRGEAELKPYAPATGSRADADFPQMVSGGISFRPTERWNIEVAADWTDWNCVDTLVFEDANPIFSSDVQLPLNWRSSWFYHFGVTHYFPNGYFASIGYFFSENSTSERNFTPYVPDTDLHVGSIGAGYKGTHWNFALAAQLITGPWREVDDHQSPSLIGETANGKYQFFVPAVSLSLGFRF